MTSTLRAVRRLFHPVVSTSAVITTACVAAIVLIVAVLAWPEASTSPAPAAEIANTSSVPAAAPAQPTFVAAQPPAGRQIQLDLPPIGAERESGGDAANVTAVGRPVAVAGVEATPDTESVTRVELIVDGGFERGSDAWYLQPPAAFATGPALRGDRYLSLRPGDGYAGQRFAVEPGASYRVTVWVWTSNPGAAGEVGVRFEDDGYRAVEVLDPQTLTPESSGWTRIRFTVTAPDAATQAILSFRNPSQSAAVRIDSVSVRILAEE